MSETIRSYMGEGQALLPRRRAKRRRLGPKVLAGLVLVLALYLFWITRDTHPIEHFIPSQQRLEIFVTDVLNKRMKMTRSTVWDALPEDHWSAGIPKLLDADLEMPEWVLRNLIGQNGHISANDLDGLEDVLFITKMTPVGCLIERVYRYLPGIAHDAAGGLHMRRLSGPGLFYAVRGRILAVSPSRRALIHALTLTEDERTEERTVTDAFVRALSEDLSGTLVLNAEGTAGQVFKSLSFAVRVGLSEGHLMFEAALQPQWEERLSRLLAHAQPRKLAPPLEGRLEISADFGMPIKDLWVALGEASGFPSISQTQWELWETTEEEGAVAPVLTALLGPLGPGFRLTWHGEDLNAMMPVPEIVATFDGQKDAVMALFESLPGPPEGPAFFEPYPYFDREAKRLRAPTIGGPSLETEAGWYGDSLLISTSRTVAEAYLSKPRDPANLSDEPGTGNLYLSVQPLPCVKALARAGELLAENSLLKGHTPESFEKTAARWMEKAAKIQKLTVLLGFEEGLLKGEIHVTCPPAGTTLRTDSL